MYNNNLCSLLSANSFIPLHRSIVEVLGVLEASVLCELCTESDYWNTKRELDEDGYFFSTYENIEKRLRIKRRQQERIIQSLMDKNLVDVKVQNRKRYIKICVQNIFDMIGNYVQNERIITDEMYELLGTKCTTKEINKKINKEIYIDKPKFKKPTLKEIEAYCKERKSTVDAKQFFEYYEEGDWKDGNGNQVKNWKQKLITWENRNKKRNGYRKNNETYNYERILTQEEKEQEKERERLFWFNFYKARGDEYAASKYAQ